jgi:hypothetical protein
MQSKKLVAYQRHLFSFEIFTQMQAFGLISNEKS